MTEPASSAAEAMARAEELMASLKAAAVPVVQTHTSDPTAHRTNFEAKLSENPELADTLKANIRATLQKKKENQSQSNLHAAVSSNEASSASIASPRTKPAVVEEVAAPLKPAAPPSADNVGKPKAPSAKRLTGEKKTSSTKPASVTRQPSAGKGSKVMAADGADKPHLSVIKVMEATGDNQLYDGDGKLIPAAPEDELTPADIERRANLRRQREEFAANRLADQEDRDEARRQRAAALLPTKIKGPPAEEKAPATGVKKPAKSSSRPTSAAAATDKAKKPVSAKRATGPVPAGATAAPAVKRTPSATNVKSSSAAARAASPPPAPLTKSASISGKRVASRSAAPARQGSSSKLAAGDAAPKSVLASIQQAQSSSGGYASSSALKKQGSVKNTAESKIAAPSKAESAARRAMSPPPPSSKLAAPKPADKRSQTPAPQPTVSKAAAPPPEAEEMHEAGGHSAQPTPRSPTQPKSPVAAPIVRVEPPKPAPAPLSPAPPKVSSPRDHDSPSDGLTPPPPASLATLASPPMNPKRNKAISSSFSIPGPASITLALPPKRPSAGSGAQAGVSLDIEIAATQAEDDEEEVPPPLPPDEDFALDEPPPLPPQEEPVPEPVPSPVSKPKIPTPAIASSPSIKPAAAPAVASPSIIPTPAVAKSPAPSVPLVMKSPAPAAVSTAPAVTAAPTKAAAPIASKRRAGPGDRMKAKLKAQDDKTKKLDSTASAKEEEEDPAIKKAKQTSAGIAAAAMERAKKLKQKSHLQLPPPNAKGGAAVGVSVAEEKKTEQNLSLSPRAAPVSIRKRSSVSESTQEALLHSLSPRGMNRSASLSVKTSELKLSNEKAILEALKALQDRNNTTSWVICVVEDDNSIALQETGTSSGDAGLEQMRNRLDDTRVQFIFFSISNKDNKELESSAKVALIVWLGERAKGMQKARSGPQRVELTAFARRALTVSAELVTSDREEIIMRSLQNALLGVKGAVGGSGVVGIGGNKRDQEMEEKLRKALDPSIINAQREKAEKEAKARFALAGRTQEDLELEGKPAVEFVLKRLVEDHPDDQDAALSPPLALPDGQTEHEEDWKWQFLGIDGDDEDRGVVFVIEGKEFKKLRTLASGGLRRCIQFLTAPARSSSCCVCVANIRTRDYGHAVDKLLYIQWIGPQLGPVEMSRARVTFPSVHAFAHSVAPMTGELESRDPGDFTRDNLLQRLSGSRVRATTQISSLGAPKAEMFKGFGKQRTAIHFQDDMAFRESVHALVRDAVPEEEVKTMPTWLLVRCSKKTADLLYIAAQGTDNEVTEQDPESILESVQSGGDPPFIDFLTPKSICFVLHRVHVVPPHLRDSVNARFATPYYCLIRWQGDQCGVMETALSSHHWTHFNKLVAEALQFKDAALQPGHLRSSAVTEVTRNAVIKYFKLDEKD